MRHAFSVGGTGPERVRLEIRLAPLDGRLDRSVRGRQLCLHGPRSVFWEDLEGRAGHQLRGDVIMAHKNDGAVALLESGPRGRIVGSVLNTLNAGMPGAPVFIVGTGIESRTDREGRFVLGRLDPGIYAVNFTHPYPESFGYVPEPVEVEVMADVESPPEVHFSTPTVRWIVEQVCRAEERPEPLKVGGAKFPMDGFLTGQVDRPGRKPRARCDGPHSLDPIRTRRDGRPDPHRSQEGVRDAEDQRVGVLHRVLGPR